MSDDDGLEKAYAKILPRFPNERPQMLYCGIVEHPHGSVIVFGTSKADSDIQFIAQPVNPLMNRDDPTDAATLERLRREVVRTTDYVTYRWTEDDK